MNKEENENRRFIYVFSGIDKIKPKDDKDKKSNNVEKENKANVNPMDIENKGKDRVSKIFEPVMLSMYAYVKNNPVRYIDPDGKVEINLGIEKKATEVLQKAPPIIKNALSPLAKDVDSLLHHNVLPSIPGELTIKPTLDFNAKKVGVDVQYEIKVDWGNLGK